MKRIRKVALMALVGLGLAGGLRAQDDTILILDDEKPAVEVKIEPRASEEPKRDLDPAAPTPAPEDVLVAIVNSHVLTRADLDARIADRYEAILNDVQSRRGGVVTTIGADGKAVDPRALSTEDVMVLEEQQRHIDRAIRQEESQAVESWVEYRMLADEARRQGIVVTEAEFRERLADVERQSDLDAKEVDFLLKELRFTRQDYERSIYDALMIEKLLNRFIEINYDEPYLRARYDENPQLYYEPERWQIAQFAISLSGEESKGRLKDLREMADDVQKRLAKGEDPVKVFAKDKYQRIDEGVWGQLPSWYYLDGGGLPPAVVAEARKLGVGDTSGVIEQKVRTGGQTLVRSIHVIKIMAYEAETGTTFESARPAIHRALIEIARLRLTDRLRSARTHRVITNMSGIPASKIPTPDEILEREAASQPISLKMPPGEQASARATNDR